MIGFDSLAKKDRRGRSRWLACVILLGCNAADGGRRAPSSSTRLEPIDPSPALPSNLPPPSYAEQRRAEEAAILTSTSLDQVLDRLWNRFGDERSVGDARYPIQIVGFPPDGRYLLERWAASHLRFSELAGGDTLAPDALPRKLGSVFCIQSKAFHIHPTQASPRLASISREERPGPGFELRAFGDVPSTSTHRGRFCGVYTGRRVAFGEAKTIVVGMFDTPANRGAAP